MCSPPLSPNGGARSRWRIAITGAVLLVWARIDSADRRGDELAVEADRRGGAVGTLATDVRQLRAQLEAAGQDPHSAGPRQGGGGPPIAGRVARTPE